MNDKLDLSLPEQASGKRKPSAGIPSVLLVLILFAVVANLGVTWSRRSNPDTGDTRANVLSRDARKQLALKLEKQGLHMTAVQAWRDYLDAATVAADESAKVWYRIGQLYEDADRFEQALDSYYRSESFAQVDELSPEIARRIERCLESLGKFAALRYELAERVGVSESSDTLGETVVAEIGARKISKAELDSIIESQVERQLSQFASYLPDEERSKQKETMLQQFSTTEQRMLFLNQFILQEILSRKAREMKLTDDPDVRAILEDQERAILASRVIETEYTDQIKITAGDVQTYYEAHKASYMRPEQARIGHILLADAAAASAALARAKDEDFEKLAAELSSDDATREKGGEIDGWITKGGPIPGIGASQDAQRIIFATDAGQIGGEVVKTENGHHIIKVLERRPETRKPFEEVRQQVYQTLRSQKERDVQERLLTELRERYDVVVHQSAFAEGERGAAESK